jgi:uncharacterized membrane protein
VQGQIRRQSGAVFEPDCGKFEEELRLLQLTNMMNNGGWMGFGTGGGMWIWTLIAALVAILLVVLIKKVSQK